MFQVPLIVKVVLDASAIWAASEFAPVAALEVTSVPPLKAKIELLVGAETVTREVTVPEIELVK